MRGPSSAAASPSTCSPTSWTCREDELDGPLQELCDHFLLCHPGDDGYFDFPHQLLREAIYRSVKVGDRRRYHARAGEFGARLIGQSEIHASAHFERAGMRREAHRDRPRGRP